MAEAEQARQDAQILRTEAVELIAQAEEAEAQAAEYRRLAENPPETKETTIFVYNLSGQLLGEYSETGETIREYVWLDDMPVAMLQGSDTYYIHSDHLNAPVALTDQNQNIVWKAEYKPFGTVNETVSEIEFNLRRPGQYHDRETNLYENHKRELDPETGRYYQSDPIGLDGGLNTYAYVGANPINFIDSKGLAKSRLGQEYRPCDQSDYALCQKQCGSRGIKKCDRLWYFKPVRVTKGVKVYDWKPGPLSCVCKDDPNEPICDTTCKFFVGIGIGLLCLTPIPGDEVAAVSAVTGTLAAQ